MPNFISSLTGASLKALPGIRFQRIALIGNVLPVDYEWQTPYRHGQLKEIRNHRSSRDWPVGILCSALRSLHMRDIGTGGFEGFRWNGNATKEIYYYRSGHSAPLETQYLSNLVG